MFQNSPHLNQSSKLCVAKNRSVNRIYMVVGGVMWPSPWLPLPHLYTAFSSLRCAVKPIISKTSHRLCPLFEWRRKIPQLASAVLKKNIKKWLYNINVRGGGEQSRHTEKKSNIQCCARLKLQNFTEDLK